jgi:hypothetical protein
MEEVVAEPEPPELWTDLPPGLREFLSGPFQEATTPAWSSGIPTADQRKEAADQPPGEPQPTSTWTPSQRNLWVGAGVTSRLHFDAHDNLHGVLHGRKIFLLYPPNTVR